MFIAAPTVIGMLDDSIDISVFYAMSEEEEKGSEKNISKEVFFSELHIQDSDAISSEKEHHLGYYFKKYSKPHLNIISPPPQLHIL